MISIILVFFLGKVRKLRYFLSRRFKNPAKIGWCLLFPRHVVGSDRQQPSWAAHAQRARVQSKFRSADWSVMLTHLPHRNGVQSRQREHRDHGISMWRQQA
jgi:hypothetical protein